VTEGRLSVHPGVIAPPPVALVT